MRRYALECMQLLLFKVRNMHLGSSKSIQSSKQSHQKQKNLEKCQLILQQRNISSSFQSFFLLQSRFFRQTNHCSKQIPIRVRWLRPLAGAANFFMVIEPNFISNVPKRCFSDMEIKLGLHQFLSTT